TTVVVTSNTYVLSGLASGSTYHWQVATICDSTGINSSAFSGYNTFSVGSCNLSFGSQVSNISCNGLTDGSIDLTPAGGSGLYTYLWSTGAVTEDLSGLSAGTYSVVLTDTWGCTDSSTFVITEPAALSISINALGNTTICISESRTLSLVGFASTANTYQWSDVNGLIVGATSSTYSVTSTGTYSLTETSPNGCITLSNGISITVLSTAVPSSLFTSNIELDKATMNWGSVLNAHKYHIRMRVQGGAWSVFINNIPSSFTSKQKANLQSASTYEWSIRSACSSDTSSSSAWSSVQSFTTLTPCTVPNNALTSSITLIGASLGWDAVAGSYGYAVRYKGVSQPWSAWTTVVVTSNTYVLSGLASSSSYHWQVATICDSTGINSSAFSGYNTFS
ncbi:MAG: SprB repeat-containing protein, partial [Flavobacteriales bacterium]